MSDHALVYAILRVFSPKCRSQKICFRSMKNFDVDKFCDDLNYAPFVTVMNSFEDVNDKLFAFESMYTSILDEHAPMKTVRVRGNQVPFMSDEWRKAIRYRNRLWKVFTKDRSDANYAAYKYQRNICTSLRRRAIKTYFRKRSDEMNQDSRQFWNTYHPFLHSRHGLKSNDIILKEGAEIITDKSRIANIFNDYFVNIANHIEAPSGEVYGGDFSDHPSVMAISGSVSSSFSFSPTNSTCVKQLLLDINIRKSPGYDNITPRLLKLSAECVAEPLCAIFNAAIDQSTYPAAWKKGQITPIPKGSDSEIDKTLFRPVTVLPAVNNIFEKILASQLTSYFQGVLSDFLSAYRKHHSCHTTLLRLVEDWKKSLDDGKLVAMVAMDLSKAFDSLPHSLLISKLRAYGLDNSSCAFLQNYLTGRFQRVKVGDELSCWELNRRGVPQGSVLGPLCFNVFLNDLSYFISRVSLNAYADDQQVYGADSDHEALYASLDHELREASQWFRMNGLMANPSKFQALVLGSTEQDFPFNIDGQQIQRCDDVDVLGVNIDSKLSFDKHISSICSKVNKQLSVVKRFKHLIGDHIKRRLYNAFILPVFNYCSDVWHFCSKRSKDKLEQLNKQALRTVLNSNSDYETLLRIIGSVNLESSRVQNMLITTYKTLYGIAPPYLKSLLKVAYNLRGTLKLNLPRVTTTTYGLQSFRYAATQVWNMLPDDIRTSESLIAFKRAIQNITA